MKKSIMSIVLMFTVALAFASNPISIIDGLSNETISFEVEDDSHLTFFTAISFNETNKNITLKTKEDISFIQVLNNDKEIEFQMPVLSSNIHLFASDYDQGEYEVVLTIKETEVKTLMKIK